MRKHNVECKIVGKSSDDLNELQSNVNFYYAQNVSNILKRNNITKEQKIYILEQIQMKYDKATEGGR